MALYTYTSNSNASNGNAGVLIASGFCPIGGTADFTAAEVVLCQNDGCVLTPAGSQQPVVLPTNFAFPLTTAGIPPSSSPVLVTSDQLTAAVGNVTSLRLGSFNLSDLPTVTTDASLGKSYSLTPTQNFTMAAPTNPSVDQTIIYKITQDATGGRTVTWDPAFRFSLDLPTVTLSTGGGLRDYISFRYSVTVSKWDCVGAIKGF
jgi:hypothetical protein